MASLKSTLITTAVIGFCLPLVVVTFCHLFQSHRPIASVKATNIEIISTITPTSVPTPTIVISDTKTYKDTDYNFKITFPSSWQEVISQKNNFGLETYTIYSPDKSESLEIFISEGIWENVELELGPGSQKKSLLGSPCLVRKNGKTTVYILPPKTKSQIFRLSVTGDSQQITKIFNSFKFI